MAGWKRVRADLFNVDAFAQKQAVAFTDDLRRIQAPVLVLHGEDDQVVPIADSARKAIRLLRNGTLKTYPGLSHGMFATHPDVINADLLAFGDG